MIPCIEYESPENFNFDKHFLHDYQLKRIMVFWWLQERPINEDAVKIMKARAKVGPASVASEEDIAMRLLTR